MGLVEGFVVKERRRRWSAEFKRDAVALVRSSGRSMAEIARELGVGESSLAYWVRKDREERAAANPEEFAAGETLTEEKRRLAKRVSELETEREILKRAAVFWMRESNE